MKPAAVELGVKVSMGQVITELLVWENASAADLALVIARIERMKLMLLAELDAADNAKGEAE